MAKSQRFIDEFGEEIIKALVLPSSAIRPYLSHYDGTGYVHLFFCLERESGLECMLPDSLYDPEDMHPEMAIEEVANLLECTKNEIRERFGSANLL